VGETRVSREHELEGLDSSEHGVDTYPEFGGPDEAVRVDGGVRMDGGERIGSSRPSSDRMSDGGSYGGVEKTTTDEGDD
jgi:Amt family ammonium transporter